MPRLFEPLKQTPFQPKLGRGGRQHSGRELARVSHQNEAIRTVPEGNQAARLHRLRCLVDKHRGEMQPAGLGGVFKRGGPAST
eukprot:CAMPEP_0171806412 /NCGR_PEP_ID=MMETSP0991-20121206/75285_1 /TAXON_ID=483369 /ORGANISM="non described non described, Strain CCMP2098" /LENGTH=82 /DNA_ID=CAMNT_0012419159 /DNA_START=202 /DNA_END=450 /DNA_ORIENTATION=-